MAEPNNASGAAGTGTTASQKPPPLASATAAAKPGSSADQLAPATAADIQASGAISEPGATANINVAHPAVDNNPRAGVHPDSNRIDFNDPGKPGPEAVADSLRVQGKLTSEAPQKTAEKPAEKA